MLSRKAGGRLFHTVREAPLSSGVTWPRDADQNILNSESNGITTPPIVRI